LVSDQRTLVYEDLSERLGFIKHPGMHCLDQSIARHEVELKRQNAEEQVAVGAGLRGTRGGHRWPPFCSQE
jgi:hypothetical protein